MSYNLTFDECRFDHPQFEPCFRETHHAEFFRFWIKNRDKMGKTILNIGLDNNPNFPSWPWCDWFIDKMKYEEVCVLELVKENVDFLQEHFKHSKNVQVIQGDVCEATKYIKKNYDTIFWWHGPEHIPLEKLPIAYKELKSITNNCMLFNCPWGKYYGLHSGRHIGDPHHFYPENEHFTNLGMQVFNDGGAYSTGFANINAYEFIIKENN